jgi:hypothetical protein
MKTTAMTGEAVTEGLAREVPIAETETVMVAGGMTTVGKTLTGLAGALTHANDAGPEIVLPIDINVAAVTAMTVLDEMDLPILDVGQSAMTAESGEMLILSGYR